MLAAEDLSKIVRKKQQSKGKNKKPKKVKLSNGELSDLDSDEEQIKISKCKDDGDLKYYEHRLQMYMDRKEADDSAQKSDFTFDGGLRVPYHLWKALYKYQKTGVKWLWELHCQQVGGILGDEMGLGKTIQIVVFLAALQHSKLMDKAPPRYRGLGPTIIVTPVTVMHQWVKEFHSWYPPARVAVLHSTGSSSSTASNLLHSMVSAQSVVITSYSTFVNQQEHILKHKWQYIILDEGHMIRNPEAQITVAVKRLKTVHRLILSGSPIQNNLKELWSLYDFVFPGRLGMQTEFMEHFAVPITQGGYANASQTQVLTAYKCACVLRESISPYLIRRMKADVNAKQLKLPSKSEQVLFCRLTTEQRKVYGEYIGSGEVANIMTGRLLVFPGLIKLRKICNHPDLVTGELRTNYSDGNISEKQKRFGYYKRSGKLIVCKALLEMWKRQGRKVLLFTQSAQMLDILERFVQTEGYNYLRMDGTTSIGSRQVLVNKFNQDPSIFVFILTTRVGGLGVNLVGASRVIIYDPDWNPSTDIQARERAWRIGQNRDVIIYRLICTGSLEEKIYQRQIFKQFLCNKILSNPKQRRFFRSGDLKDLFSLGEDDQDKQDSETHAIFAGTGSRIDLKKIQRKADAARKLAKLKAAEKEAADKERREKMWEMAKRLSEKMEESKENQQQTKDSNKGPEEIGGENADADEAVTAEEPAQGDLTDKESKEISSALASETRNIINSDLFNNLGDLDFESRMEDKEESVAVPKKLKDIKCEGKAIPGLAKIRKWKYAEKEKTTLAVEAPAEGRSEVEDEEYILGKLLRKSLVNGAMKHDTIVDACSADYAIVEAEADKVAQQAAEHLKRAKKRIRERSSGEKRQRFGLQSVGTVAQPGPSKKLKTSTGAINKSLRGVSTQNTQLLNAKLKAKMKSAKSLLNNKMFSGSSLSYGKTDCMQSDADIPLPSSVLLKAMRLRSGDTDDVCDAKHAKLSEDIREFIATKRNSVEGRNYVITQEVVDEFPTITGMTVAAFRAILRAICTFSKIAGVGRWTLKEEYS